MKTLLKWLLLAPIAAVALIFAISNRHMVTVVFDPFGNDVPGLQLTAPLFIVLFLAVITGVLIGGCASWLGQGKNRRAARLARADLAQARTETERLRTQLMSSQQLALTSRLDQNRTAA